MFAMFPIFSDAQPAAAVQTVGKFILFGVIHLSILVGTVALPLALSLLTRKRDRPQLARWLAVGLAATLILDRVLTLSLAVHVGRLTDWPNALPMHLCDWALFAVVIALLWRGQQAYELAYFWGLSGTVQAILTPDVSENFPNPFFISFFISHCGIIISVLFMTWGLGKRPRPGSVWRALLWNQLYLASASLVNWIFHTHHINFGYLAHKPDHASLLDFFGPWPWYVLELEVAAAAFYLFFYAPFWFADLRRGGPIPPAAVPMNVR